MGRRGALSPRTFFPNTGDMLEDHDEGMCWVTQKTHTFVDEKTGDRFRYALLVARHEDYGDDPILRTIHSQDGSKWLEEIDVIQRKKAGGHVAYEWNEASQTFQS